MSRCPGGNSLPSHSLCQAEQPACRAVGWHHTYTGVRRTPLTAEAIGFWLALLVLFLNMTVASAAPSPPRKPSGSVFLPPRLVQQARKNAATNPQAAAMR